MRFISAEPLLGPVDIGDYICHVPITLRGRPIDVRPLLDWVIVGGESGPGARPMKPEWVESIRRQCRAAKVPFFFKQWGGVRKHVAGRTLNGRVAMRLSLM